MRQHTVATLLIAMSCSVAYAQSQEQADDASNTTLAVKVQAVLSFQPADGAYVGSPYLDRGLGGVTPGVAAGLDLIARQRMVISFEFSATQPLEVEHRGRVVSGTARSELKDSLTHFLGGYSKQYNPNVRINFLAGVVLRTGVMSINRIPIGEPLGGAFGTLTVERDKSVGFGAGVDVARVTHRRINLIASLKYSFLPRTRRATQTGVGKHVLRFGAGLQFRLAP